MLWGVPTNSMYQRTFNRACRISPTTSSLVGESQPRSQSSAHRANRGNTTAPNTTILQLHANRANFREAGRAGVERTVCSSSKWVRQEPDIREDVQVSKAKIHNISNSTNSKPPTEAVGGKPGTQEQGCMKQRSSQRSNPTCKKPKRTPKRNKTRTQHFLCDPTHNNVKQLHKKKACSAIASCNLTRRLSKIYLVH